MAVVHPLRFLRKEFQRWYSAEECGAVRTHGQKCLKAKRLTPGKGSQEAERTPRYTCCVTHVMHRANPRSLGTDRSLLNVTHLPACVSPTHGQLWPILHCGDTDTDQMARGQKTARSGKQRGRKSKASRLNNVESMLLRLKCYISISCCTTEQ